MRHMHRDGPIKYNRNAIFKNRFDGMKGIGRPRRRVGGFVVGDVHQLIHTG